MRDELRQVRESMSRERVQRTKLQTQALQAVRFGVVAIGSCHTVLCPTLGLVLPCKSVNSLWSLLFFAPAKPRIDAWCRHARLSHGRLAACQQAHHPDCRPRRQSPAVAGKGMKWEDGEGMIMRERERKGTESTRCRTHEHIQYRPEQETKT